LEERGAWFELLLMMHDSDERGVLLVNGKPMPELVIARRLGLLEQNAKQILSTLLDYGVASRRENDGAIFSRRMVKDEYIRKIRSEIGSEGGKQRLLNQNAKQNGKQIPKQSGKQTAKQNSTPSSSFSSSDNRDRGAADAAALAPSPEGSSSTKKPKGDGKKGGAAARPTLAEIQAHAADAHPGPEAQAEAAAFFDHFESNGWRVGGKTPMVNWQAAFRNWLRRRPQFAPAATAGRAGAGQPTPTRARSAPKPHDPKRYS
jgi:hypothetical protein